MKNRLKRLLWRIYASVYDTVTTSYPYREMMRQVAENIPKGARVLDIGCGTGGLLEYLDGVEEYIGVDAEPAMLECAKSRARSLEEKSPGRAAKHTRFIQASIFDAVDWPTVNTVVFCNSLYTLERKLEALQVVHGLIIESGRVLICDPDGVPSVGKVLDQHFDVYAKEHGRWAMRFHKMCVLPKLIVIAVINQLIFDAFPFTKYSALALILQSAGFYIGFHNKTYAGQNLLIMARKRP